ncbi:MAG: glucosyltransferase domain-containing protein, partial [Clostridiales bacterium]|nr:glucosyltransferase domain-containing protein [Clostridiales bacterium]
MEKKDTESSLCKKYYDRLLTVWPHFPTVVCATLVFGVLAHGSALFNKYSMVDDPQYLFGMGYTFRSGRWFLGILGSLVRWFTGSPNFSLPLYSGILCLAVLALCACVLIPLLGFTKKWEWILTAGLMTVFPTVTGYFGFLFTAPYYLVGLLLCLLGCSVLCRYRKWWAYVLGIVLLALSTGIYQAFIPTALCVMLLHFLRKLTLAENWSWKDLAKDVLWYVSACLAFLALYSLMSRLCLAVTHLTLTGYNGISDPMAGGIRSYVQRIKLAYYLFLIPTGASRTAYMFPYRLHTLYYVALALLCLAAL